jgi:hypothetical protein
MVKLRAAVATSLLKDAVSYINGVEWKTYEDFPA